ncbi:MAG: zf-HC2 domain-containing protein [Pirellulaceae bacterium]|nr:zf-HC2 domain-containing protein [Pirellulaceae bacterium]
MNSSNKLNNELLTAYFDGELSQAEQMQVEQALFDSPDCLRQLREWAVLREALQNTSVVIQAQTGISGDRQIANEPSAAEAAIMNRIVTAMAGGEVKWASGGSLQTATASLDAAPVAGEPSKVRRSDSHVAEVAATQITERTPELARGDHSPSGFRRLNPTQRLRRWRWQLVAITTVAASMLLAVFMNQYPVGPRNAGTDGSRSDGNVDHSPALGERESADSSSEVVRSAAPSSSDFAGAEDVVGGGRADGGVVSNTMMPDVIVDAPMNANPSTFDYTTFVSFDVPDAGVGLQQMQSVLAENQLGPGEIYKLDDSQVVVLSGDAKKLAEVLKEFQAIGGNSLALLATVSPEGLDHPIAEPQGMDQLAESVQNFDGMEKVVPPNEGIVIQDLSSNQGISSPEENVGVQNSMIAGQYSQNIPSVSNSRHDVIRGQANVLNNLVSPPANVSIEEFLNRRPAPKEPRAPFRVNQGTQGPGGGGEQSLANPGSSDQNVNRSTARLPSTDPAANQHRINQQGPAGLVGPGTTPAVAGGQVDGQIPHRSDPTNRAAINLDTEASNGSGPTQIVVILRPKPPVPQSPNNQNP